MIYRWLGVGCTLSQNDNSEKLILVNNILLQFAFAIYFYLCSGIERTPNSVSWSIASVLVAFYVSVMYACVSMFGRWHNVTTLSRHLWAPSTPVHPMHTYTTCDRVR